MHWRFPNIIVIAICVTNVYIDTLRHISKHKPWLISACQDIEVGLESPYISIFW